MPDQHLDPIVAANYDRRHAERFEPAVLEPTLNLLAELSAGGRVLEFAIGTGRVALPLASRGVDVSGIELSEPMLAEMRTKPGGADIPVVVGDMTSTRVEGSFSLVYLVYNTIGNLVTQDAQIACFLNAAGHLAVGGHFLVEVGVPDPPRRDESSPFRPFDFTDDHIGVDEYLERNDQVFLSHHYRPNEPERRRVTGEFRYVWPSELDLMARLAGMTLADRWADWDRTPFTSRSTSHVSVWRRDRTAMSD